MSDSGTEAALAAWLDRLEKRDPTRIEPGLERIATVLGRMRLCPPPFPVLTVGGTNGKGSVVTYLAAFLAAEGRGGVGAYTSPHLGHYRERIAMDGHPVEPGELVRAFEVVEAAGGDIPLTYFEFGTAAALEVFRETRVRVAVLEVGLGGRLDAVNALDAEAAAVVSIGLDHQEWLGNDRDRIGHEKAGIFRSGRPAIIGERDPPDGLLGTAQAMGAEIRRIGVDFDVRATPEGWFYRSGELERGPFPEPPIAGWRQRDNVAVALALLEAFDDGPLPPTPWLAEALAAARLPGRIDRRCGEVEWVLDVAHNPQAAASLAAWLAVAEPRRTLAVFGMLRDKDAAAVGSLLAPHVSRWFIGTLEGRRGQSAAELATRMGTAIADPVLCENIKVAVTAALKEARPGDRIVVFGSFHTVGEALDTGKIPAQEAG
ncbi:MAG: bifunctional folylpolyglutamate synthase/dihydrofolate synthase [Gammaproteobacteria bacterium]